MKLVSWRRIVQYAFLILNIYIGYRFYIFVQAAFSDFITPLPTRPPGVEGWLPISGLMGAIDWLATGTLNSIHPAATICLLAFTAMALLLRKTFCSWFCPVGLFSELLASLGKRLFGRNIVLPRWLDRPLMAIKYLLLGFFIWAFYTMGVAGISAFIHSPYNQVSDVKMLLFFTNLETTAAIVLIILVVASVFIQGFWCRYLCPYGAFLGLFSWLSPVKVRRNSATCIDCGKCDRVCPVRLPVMSKLSIKSVECHGCMECVQACPVADTLHMGTRRYRLSPLKTGLLVILIFTMFYAGARLFGVWNSRLTDHDYRYHISRLESPEYGHPGR